MRLQPPTTRTLRSRRRSRPGPPPRVARALSISLLLVTAAISSAGNASPHARASSGALASLAPKTTTSGRGIQRSLSRQDLKRSTLDAEARTGVAGLRQRGVTRRATIRFAAVQQVCTRSDDSDSRAYVIKLNNIIQQNHLPPQRHTSALGAKLTGIRKRAEKRQHNEHSLVRAAFETAGLRQRCWRSRAHSSKEELWRVHKRLPCCGSTDSGSRWERE